MQSRLLPVVLTVGLGLSSPMAGATPVLSFIMDGDTYSSPFSITNGSDGGETVVGFQLDLSGLGLLYDTVSGGPGISPGHGLGPVGGTGVLTGLGLVAVSDGGTLLSMSFTDFSPGETFTGSIDVDSATVIDVICGDDLIGALASVSFSDGQTLQGVLVAVPGNDDASQFVVTGIDPGGAVPEPATFSLLGLGLAGLVAARRRPRSSGSADGSLRSLSPHE